MIQWSEHYNVATARLGGGALTMTVAWNSTAPKGSPSGYTVSVGPRRLKELVQSMDDGKAAAIRLAKRIVADLQAELGDRSEGPRAGAPE